MAEEAENEQAEEAGGEGEDEEGQKKKGLPLLLIIGLAVVVLALAGAGAFVFLSGGSEPEVEAHAEDGEHAEGHGDDHGEGDGHGDGHGNAKGDKHADGDGDSYGDEDHAEGAHVVFYKLPQILVNVHAEDDGPPAYLKLALTLELSDPAHVEAVEAVMPRVLDRFQSFLRELRLSDLSGSSGTYRLRTELLRRVNLAAAPVQVRAVLIEEMLVQ